MTAARRLPAILLATAAVVLALLAAEFGLRALAKEPSLETEWVMDIPGMLDDEVVFLLREQRKNAAYEIDPALPTVVALGDSFTVGIPVDPKDCYPRVVSDLLAASGKPVNLINMGIGDSGPDQQLRAFERELLSRLTPDVVVWQFFSNDVWDNVVKPTYDVRDGRLVPLSATSGWIHRRQRFYESVPYHRALKHRSMVFRYLLKAFELRKLAAVPTRHVARPNDWGLEKIDLETARMNALAHERGFDVFFVLVTPQLWYLDEQTTRSMDWAKEYLARYERLRALLERQSRFIDVRFPSASTATELFTGPDRERFPLGAHHFNEAGYRRMADLVFTRLASDNVVAAHH